MLAKVGFVHGLVPSANNTVVPGDGSIGTEMLFCLILPVRFPWLAQVCASGRRRRRRRRRSIAAIPVIAAGKLVFQWACSGTELGMANA